MRGDAEGHPVQLLLEVLPAGDQRRLAGGGRLAEAVVLGPHQAVGVDRLRERLLVELARHRHEPDLELPGAATLAHDAVAQEAAPRAAVVRLQPLLLAESQAPGRGPRCRPRRRAGSRRSGRSCPTRRARGSRRRARLLGRPLGPERVLELVAVAPRLHRRHDRLQLVAAELADPPQRVVDLLALDLQLLLVRQHLPRRARMLGDGGDAVRTRLQHLLRYRLAVVALRLRHLHAHAVAGDRALHEQHVAVVAGDAVAAEGETVDRDLELGEPIRARALCGGRRAHRTA